MSSDQGGGQRTNSGEKYGKRCKNKTVSDMPILSSHQESINVEREKLSLEMHYMYEKRSGVGLY